MESCKDLVLDDCKTEEEKSQALLSCSSKLILLDKLLKKLYEGKHKVDC